MMHKTFISYKYDEASDVRDRIINNMGDYAEYYMGETSESPDLSDLKTETIKNKLKDMIYGTTVTIVVLSPNMKESKWIDWEIEYSLKKTSRNGIKSGCNGVVAVIKKVNGGYDWFKHESTNCHNTIVVSYHMDKIHDIIAENHFNSKPEVWHCDKCKAYDALKGSYIAFIDEETFLLEPTKYIENAFEKSKNDAEGFIIKKER